MEWSGGNLSDGRRRIGAGWTERDKEIGVFYGKTLEINDTLSRDSIDSAPRRRWHAVTKLFID